MNIDEYLNQIYESDDLYHYKHGKIDIADVSETDKIVLELIQDVIDLNEDYRNRGNGFSRYHGVRLPELEKVTREDILPLLSIDLSRLPLAIRARIADFLWTMMKDHTAAVIAIHSYLELYEKVWDEDHWPPCFEAVCRATNIACAYNRNGSEYQTCVQAILNGLSRTQGKDHFYLSSSLLDLLAKQKYKLDDAILTYAHNAIEAAKIDQRVDKAQSVLETLAKLDPENRAQYFEEAGDITQELAFSPAIRLVHNLKQALQYYKEAGAKEKIKQCRQAIDDAQGHIPEDMQLIKTDPIDISDTVKQVINAFDVAVNFQQALIVFGDLVTINQREKLLENVKNESALVRLFPSARVDHKGRQIFSLPVLPLDGELTIDNEAVQQHMWDKARQLQELNAQIVLKYGYQEIGRRFSFTEEDIDFLVEKNALIPKGREKVIRRGLLIGLQGDFYSALHILIPQFENIIRHLVELCGGASYFIEANGDLKVSAIGTLLNNPELNECYDPDVLFCLKGLLDQKTGSNLRNDIAHGVLEPGNSSISLYFVALMIKLLSWYSPACWIERKKMQGRKEEGIEEQ